MGAAALGRGGGGKHEALLRKLQGLEANHRALLAGERCKVGGVTFGRQPAQHASMAGHVTDMII